MIEGTNDTHRKQLAPANGADNAPGIVAPLRHPQATKNGATKCILCAILLVKKYLLKSHYVFHSALLQMLTSMQMKIFWGGDIRAKTSCQAQL